MRSWGSGEWGRSLQGDNNGRREGRRTRGGGRGVNTITSSPLPALASFKRGRVFVKGRDVGCGAGRWWGVGGWVKREEAKPATRPSRILNMYTWYCVCVSSFESLSISTTTSISYGTPRSSTWVNDINVDGTKTNKKLNKQRVQVEEKESWGEVSSNTTYRLT